MHDPRQILGGVFLHDQKLAAWALAVGERPGRIEDELRRRSHRCMLPDVDFDRAIADPGHRPLLSRIADFLWGGVRRGAAQPDAEGDLRAELTAVLGERPAAAYIGEDETGASIRSPDEAVSKTKMPHAA